MGLGREEKKAHANHGFTKALPATASQMFGSAGRKFISADADTRAWLRLKGIREVVSGLVVLTMMLAADRRSVGIALLVQAIIPLGDMSIILGSGGWLTSNSPSSRLQK